MPVEEFAAERAAVTRSGTRRWCDAIEASPYNPRPCQSPKPLIQPNAQNEYKVDASDLPLACPMPEMYLWNSHPRVYLPIEQTGWAKCPYCGAEYTLTK